MYSRAIPESCVSSASSFLGSSALVVKSGAASDRFSVASAFLKRVTDAVVASSVSSSHAKPGLRRLSDGVDELAKLPTEAVAVARASLSVLVGAIAVFEAVEHEDVKAMLKQIAVLKNEAAPSGPARKAGARLVELLRMRSLQTNDTLAKETLDKLGARLEQELAGWSASRAATGLTRTLEVAERHLETLARPFAEKMLLEARWFEPRPARAAAHGLAAAAVARDGREVVEQGRQLAAAVARAGAVDSGRAAELQQHSARLVALARAQLAGAANKAEMAEQCRLLYAAFAEAASHQHRYVRAHLGKAHLARGELIGAALRLSLLALGSEAEATSLQDGYVWPSKRSRPTGKADTSGVASNTSLNVSRRSGGNGVTAAPRHQPAAVVSDKHLPYMGSCCVCKGAIHGRIVRALNGAYHPEHFACASCKRKVETGESFISDPHNPLLPVCSQCSARFMTQTSVGARPLQPSQNSHGPCGGCGRIVDGEHAAALGKVYHLACLKCGGCGRVVPPSEPVSRGRGGFLLCRSCSSPAAPTAVATAVAAPAPAKKRVSAARRVCAECHRDIGNEDALFEGGDMFHRSCFACSLCAKFLGDVRADFFVLGGRRQCRECYTQAMFKCFGCFQPLQRTGKEVELGGHIYHATCAPRQTPSKPLPLPQPTLDSPAASPPPSPPATRPPRWSGSILSSSGSEEDDAKRRQSAAELELDQLVADLSAPQPPARVSLQGPLMRTSRSSLPSGARAEPCWACGEPNDAQHDVCRVCGEPSLAMTAALSGVEDWTVPEPDVLSGFADSTVNGRNSTMADEEQLSALIMELNDI